MKKNCAFIIAVIVFSIAVISIIDGFIQPPYFIKSIIKLFLFVGLPALYFTIMKDNSVLRFLKPKKKGIIIFLGLGLATYFIIFGGYFCLKNVIDFSSVTKSLSEGEGVNRENFIFVALYISFINSFCEEFFFRGLAFLALKNTGLKKFAYAFSSISFAIYHIAIMTGWFSTILVVLIILLLTICALLFNYIDDKSNNIYSSWIIHLFANLGINTIGLILFNLVG